MKKLMYNKTDEGLVRMVTTRQSYNYLIHHGWGEITPDKISKKLVQIYKHLNLNRRQFRDFLDERVPKFPLGRRRLNDLLTGTPKSPVTLVELRVLAYAVGQTLTWFASKHTMVPDMPWRKWDYRDQPRIKHKITTYVVTFEFDGVESTAETVAYDRHHARAAFQGEYPEARVISVLTTKLPA